MFEIAKTATGYASAPTTLFSFECRQARRQALCRRQRRSLWDDLRGRPDEAGTVFEIVKTAAGYASAPITLVTSMPPDAFPRRPFRQAFDCRRPGRSFRTSLGGANIDFTFATAPARYSRSPAAAL